MRILLTGSTGRLGGAFKSLWGNDTKHELRMMTRRDADLSRPDQVQRFLKAAEFDVLINPAAMSGLEECLDFPDQAQAVNVDSPRVMAEVCQQQGARLVHFSTDYVFAGSNAGRKTETDPVGAINVYGTTKQAGERAVLAASPDALVCRVSWLFGPTTPERPTHFDNVINRALTGEPQNLITDKYSVPTYTHDIVGWVGLLLQSGSTGVYHLCNKGEPESWFSYAEKICDLARQQGLDMDRATLKKSSIQDAHFFREKRPVHTAMLPARLENEGLVAPRHWLEAAEVYLKIR